MSSGDFFLNTTMTKVAQMLKNLCAIQETQIQFLGQEGF